MIPTRTNAQRNEALHKANAIRTYRARLKTSIRASEADPVMAIAIPDEQLVTMRVFDLLLAVPSVGRVKANKMLTRTRVSPSKTVGGLSDRQRTELVTLLEVAIMPTAKRQRERARARSIRAMRRAA